MGFHIYMYIPFLAKKKKKKRSNNICPSNAHFLVEYPALFPKICNIMAVNGLWYAY